MNEGKNRSKWQRGQTCLFFFLPSDTLILSPSLNQSVYHVTLDFQVDRVRMPGLELFRYEDAEGTCNVSSVSMTEVGADQADGEWDDEGDMRILMTISHQFFHGSSFIRSFWSLLPSSSVAIPPHPAHKADKRRNRWDISEWCKNDLDVVPLISSL